MGTLLPLFVGRDIGPKKDDSYSVSERIYERVRIIAYLVLLISILALSIYIKSEQQCSRQDKN